MSVNTQLIRCPKCGANNRVSLNSPPLKQPICGRCKTPLAFADSPLTITDANFGREVEKSPLPVLLDFWAAWCGKRKSAVRAVTRTFSKKLRLWRDIAGKLAVQHRRNNHCCLNRERGNSGNDETLHNLNSPA